MLTKAEHHAALAREMKAMPVALNAVNEDGLFEGYACLFGKADLGDDLIRPGAFAKSLARRGIEGVKMLYQHDPAQPVGQWLEIREDTKGLFVRGQLALDVAKAREVQTMMKSGILDGLSIGFRTILGHTDKKSGIRHLIELDLWEISIVTFPMQPEARISSLKAHGGPISKRTLERTLTQDAGLSRNQARALLAQGFSGLSGLIGKQDAVAFSHSHPLLALRRLTRSMNGAVKAARSR